MFNVAAISRIVNFNTYNRCIVRIKNNSSPLSFAFRIFCSSSEHRVSFPQDQKSISIYQDAITISDDDPLITLEDRINKAFALLACDKGAFSWTAWHCLKKARQLDMEKKYEKVISCGLEQASSECTQATCYHVIKPT